MALLAFRNKLKIQIIGIKVEIYGRYNLKKYLNPSRQIKKMKKK